MYAKMSENCETLHYWLSTFGYVIDSPKNFKKQTKQKRPDSIHQEQLSQWISLGMEQNT